MFRSGRPLQVDTNSYNTRISTGNFDDFQVNYKRWDSGELTSKQVVDQFGTDVLEMMQTQYVAIMELDEVSEGERGLTARLVE